MTKTVHPVLKKTGAVLLTVLVLVLMAVPAFAVALPDAPTGYVYDGANVLSSSTESYIERTGSALAEACGAEVVVATVDFPDGEDIADYAYDLFNKWGIGDKKSMFLPAACWTRCCMTTLRTILPRKSTTAA